jgi:preprotein translocase subunit YajC
VDPLFLGIIALAFVGIFFMQRNQRKRLKQQTEFRNLLGPGDEVMTASGLFGTVVEVDEATDRITLEAAGSRTVWLRAAISKKIEAPGDDVAATGSAADATIAPTSFDVPDDISGLDTAQREYRDQQRKDNEGK